MDGQEIADEADQAESLHLLLESCASITKTALSCRTLGTRSSCRRHEQGELSTLCQTEEDLGNWLQRQIIDYRAAIARTSRLASNNEDVFLARKRAREETDETENQSKKIQHLEEKLLDESCQLQQEHRLLSRIKMSAIAQQTLVARHHDTDEVQRNKSFLCREALKSRDEQVCLALEKLDRLDAVDKELQALTEENLRLQERNRDFWQNRLGPKAPSNTSETTQNVDPSEILETENLILKCALLDIIVGSGVDWYSNERIRNTMMKLET